ncbi:hypothetical protein SCHPADRAFT_804417, partial [Schizopora paradoxa]
KYRAASDNLELVTVVECVCADGTSVPPGFVFQGKRLQTSWFKDNKDLGVGGVAVSENGWIDDFLALEWFKKVFIPFAKARNVSGKPILLI